MRTQEKALYLVTIALLISIGALGWMWRKDKEKVIEQKNIITALTDTLVITKNKFGQQTAKISKFETEKVSDFLKIQGLIGVNKTLQEQVNLNKNRLGNAGSVSVVSTDTKIDTVVKTIVTPKDTVIVAGQVTVFPEYKAEVHLGKWINGETVANRDSTRLTISVLNEYSLVIGEDPVKGTGFLGIGRKKAPFSEVTNLNPYSSTKTLRTYQVKSTIKKPKLSLGVQGGYSPFTGSYVGVGIQYNLITF